MKSLDHATACLARFFRDHRKVIVLTGAGVSAASGIPTYRDRQGVWLHSEPIKHQEFITDPLKRKRYWARSMRGWPAVRDAVPNGTHRAIAELERSGLVSAVITQNVDRLHQRAGSRRVIDLHGRLDRVRCIDCDARHSRESLQRKLTRLNPPHVHEAISTARPDGDADLPDTMVENVFVPDCPRCHGLLMPDVVFFGGTVPGDRVDSCMKALADSDALLAVGSSLQVFSGFRFCRRAAETGKTIGIINPGTTRADDLADFKLEVDCGEVLPRFTCQLPPSSAHDNPS